MVPKQVRKLIFGYRMCEYSLVTSSKAVPKSFCTLITKNAHSLPDE
jgi:hypothetical protein